MIGQDCLFAPDVFIRAEDAHKIIDVNSGETINCAQDVIIEDHV